MISRPALHRMLNQLYHRKADVESLIHFFEKYGKNAQRRSVTPKRSLRVASKLATAN